MKGHITLDDQMTPALQRISTQLHVVTFDKTRKQLKASLGLVAWWALCVFIPVLSVVCGIIVGAIIGASSGAVAGVTEAKADLTKWLEAMTK